MGCEAEHADEWAEGMADHEELRDMLGLNGEEAYRKSIVGQMKIEADKEKIRQQARDRYAKNKAAKVGTHIKCATCCHGFTKTHYAQAFCKTKKRGKSNCKDVYHNTTNKKRRERAHQYGNIEE